MFLLKYNLFFFGGGVFVVGQGSKAPSLRPISCFLDP